MVRDRSTSSELAGPACGQYCRMAFATGLMRLAGITLPGNGVRVMEPSGFRTVVKGS